MKFSFPTLGEARVRLLLWLLLAAGLLRVYAPVWRSHSALIVADPYTYVSYAKNLARGRFTIDNSISMLVREQHSAGAAGARQGVVGPVWNTAVRPDGSMVYTVEAPYPLFLSLVIRVGGVLAALHSNFLLWPVLLTLLFLLVKRGFGPGVAGLAAAAAACLLFPAFDHPTFRQMHYPWREPFFMTLLLGGLLSVQAFTRSGRTRWLSLSALLLGLGCSIKIANAVYMPVVGLFVLASGAFRKHPRKGALILLCAVLFLVGLLPFFIQNVLATGHPFKSLQIIRETREYSATEIGHGLSFGNYFMTPRRYRMSVYRDAFLLHGPVILLALSALWTLRKKPFVWLVTGLLAAHLALYLQWGNADNRHMVFATLLYSILLGGAAAGWMERRGALVCLPVLLALFVPLARVEETRAPEVFSAADATRLVEKLESVVESPALVLSNRKLRDVIGTYAGFEVAAFHELLSMHSGDLAAPLLRRLLETGRHLYFLDNQDRDPKHWVGWRGRGAIVDFALADETFLREHFRLEPVLKLSAEEYELEGFEDRREMTLYRLRNWENREVTLPLAAPAEGSSFLLLNARAAGTNLQVTVNNQPVDVATHARRFYHPALLPAGPAVLRATSPEPLPDLADARLIGWEEKIPVDLGYDAQPMDGGYLDRPASEFIDWDHRRFTNDFSVVLPVRNTDDCATLLTLRLSRVSKGWKDNAPTSVLDRPDLLLVRIGEGPVLHARGDEGAYWCLVPPVLPSPHAGYARIHVPETPEFKTKVEGYVSSTAWRRRSIPVGEAAGLVVSGKIAPDLDLSVLPPRVTTTPPSFPWSVKSGGREIARGKCNADIRQSRNQFHLFAGRSDATQGVWNLEFEGMSVADFQAAPLGGTLSLSWTDVTRACAVRGFYPAEKDEKGRRLAWARAASAVMVPVTPGVSAYELRLSLRNATPAVGRAIRIRFMGREQVLALPPAPEPATHTVRWTNCPSPAGPDCAELVFETEVWNPKRAGVSDDDRDLGFQLYTLEWRPEKPGDSP